MEIKRIKTPLEGNVIEQLRAGEKVFLTGRLSSLILPVSSSS